MGDEAALYDAVATLLRREIIERVADAYGGAEWRMIEEWKRLADTESNSRWRSDYAALALVFADLTGQWPTWRQALERWNMRESQQVLEWQEEARLEMQRADLLRLLQLRFSTPLPEELTAAVGERTELADLSRWFDAAATAISLEEFRATIQH